MCPGEIFSLD